MTPKPVVSEHPLMKFVGPKPLYPDPDSGLPILTNSMMSAFRRCIKQAEYKYYHRLKPKMLGKPLKRGTWVHSLLEEDARGGDWRLLHTKLTKQFDNLFDEEKEFYGDLPNEILALMEAYFWHYKQDPWTYHEVELELTAELNGIKIRIKFDALVENQWGLWLVDHKTHKTLPKLEYRMLDTQSPLYIWVAHQNNIPVNGFIWNYIKWKPPTMPKLVYKGQARQRLSLQDIETDYPTYIRALKQFRDEDGLVITQDYKDKAKYLKSLQYEPGRTQASPFFRRDVMEKSDDMIGRVLKEAHRTASRMNSYDFTDPDAVERTVGRHCEFMCSYKDICSMELLGANTRPLLRQNYEVGDPLSYYHDRAGDIEGKEE